MGSSVALSGEDMGLLLSVNGVESREVALAAPSDPVIGASGAGRRGVPVIRLTRRWTWEATSTAVGTATITATANEVIHAGTRLGVNPSLTIVSTSDTTSDIAMAMIAGTSTDA
jgi:hypothetical protein